MDNNTTYGGSADHGNNDENNNDHSGNNHDGYWGEDDEGYEEHRNEDDEGYEEHGNEDDGNEDDGNEDDNSEYDTNPPPVERDKVFFDGCLKVRKRYRDMDFSFKPKDWKSKDPSSYRYNDEYGNPWMVNMDYSEVMKELVSGAFI